MAKSSKEIEEMAHEVVAESLEIVEEIENLNNSFWKRVPKPAIGYLIHAMREFSKTILNVTKTAAVLEDTITRLDEEIDQLNRKVFAQVLEINHLKARLGE